jgi:hypothetical protein
MCLRFIALNVSHNRYIQLIALISLSQKLEVTVWRDGKECRQSYSRGKPMTALSTVTMPGESSARQGTGIRFWPDKDSKFVFLKRVLCPKCLYCCCPDTYHLF